GLCGLCVFGLTRIPLIFCGWEISRIEWGFVFLWLTQMPQILLIFLWVGNLTDCVGGALLITAKYAKGMSLRYDAPVA
ncbi:MAG: hypothetical protein SOX37_05270, partial [Sodaliphilus sp.]|nr:hypothetical protein [Sodaliphilus sp.]